MRTCILLSLVGFSLLGLAGTPALGSAATSPPPAEWQLTPFVGFQTGGNLDDVSTGRTLDFDAGGVLGITVGRSLDHETRLEGTWSHQRSTLSGTGISLAVDHLHFAGVYEPEPKKRAGGFVLFSAGVSRLALDQPGLDPETRFSLSIGGGGRFPLGNHISLRLEARGWFIFTNSDGSAFCSQGGCQFRFSGDGILQVEISTGITFAF